MVPVVMDVLEGFFLSTQVTLAEPVDGCIFWNESRNVHSSKDAMFAILSEWTPIIYV